ncbi:putative enzyme [Thiomonas arsenitoxydans]|uniref:Enzyme n=1 Tax=Thiomonas arsenitoxydans (strain DSM 22701 / CIP 110005 / 3As) TaxID=426114 RepID=D6CUC4_THIA3|nr:plasma-membrane proton-efflux P-type ATPase [Thiomonas arsenitoxydans]CAZ88893.1 Putative Proton-exporting ATPase [Thiomonas arsenitoxydans]CQR29266.1 putative enzyme [Thiomonas arsenitoxydans]CQR35214.1 putative enzyme [Thiomonas arsenitoxydans]CQR35677.1 putative enzyme [Thiomonas arsenitoxydans]CQR35762.1 putative enzyme [Thiomonas arsenitoxydans]
MNPSNPTLDAKAVAAMSADALLQSLHSKAGGLTQTEAAQRLAQGGPNSLPEQHVSLLMRLLRYFWGPIPWMIEVAALLSALVRHWPDFIIIVLLLLFNAGIGFWQEFKASSALDALKKQLALKCRVKRDGQWTQIDTAQLVPGDVVRVRLGDILPADLKLIAGDYLSVDQSALTGESLPVSRKLGEVVYSGSIAKQGEMVGVVYATGVNTYLGKTAQLVQKAGAVSHFQKAVLNIGDYLIYVSLGLVAILVLVELQRGLPWIDLLQFALILTVASIPVAMPAVLSVTMALGALALSKEKAIVSRLESIEELAAVDVLCSDKTGTLTQNKLTLGDPLLLAVPDAATLNLHAALASQPDNGDAIDQAVYAAQPVPSTTPAGFTAAGFTPFDPVGKRSEGRWTDAQGAPLAATKGAPQVILDLCKLNADVRSKADAWIDAQAAKGLRTLGVASKTGDDVWQLDGLLSLFDPPRSDSRQTIADARSHGLAVKMVTGDNVAIAREIGGQLGIGTQIVAAGDVFDADKQQPGVSLADQIDAADGFAQVFPEHKYGIVKALQDAGHRVAMTGDGVNDAPALKQADVGIAVSGATDAARAAAALILTAPGLSTIVKAVEEARRIFERMNSYAIYRITETIRIMVFVVAAMLAYNFYPITAVMIILLAFFNDVPIMTIAYDRTAVDAQPVRWDMRRVITVSTVLGLIGVGETLLLLWFAHEVMKLDMGSIQTFIFLKLAVSGHLTLFVARSRKAFWKKPWPSPALLWSAILTKALATLFVVFPLGLIAPISWSAVGLIWVYCVFWAFVEDQAKLAVYRHFDRSTPRHLSFLHLLKQRTFKPGQ